MTMKKDEPRISRELVDWLTASFLNTLPHTKFTDPASAAMEIAYRQGQQSLLTFLKAWHERQEQDPHK